MPISRGHRVAALGAVLTACTPTTWFTPSGGRCLERGPDCQFEIISSRPERDYQVIGVIDVAAFGARYLPNDEASFRRAVGAEVCRVGGEAVIPGVNGDHRYILATVVKWVSDGQKDPVCPKAKPDAGVPDAGAKGGASDAGAEGGASDAGVPEATPAPDAAAHSQLGTKSGRGGAPC